MEVRCPGCGSNASRILDGTDGHQYAKCLTCGETQLLEPQVRPQLASNTETMHFNSIDRLQAKAPADDEAVH
jgi:hypothetical protein